LSPPFAITLFTNGVVGLCGGKKTTTSPISGDLDKIFALPVNGSWEIPEGSFFVSGDNRDNSSDSREWGYITEDVIWGRADFIWMSWPQGNFPNFSRVGKVE